MQPHRFASNAGTKRCLNCGKDESDPIHKEFVKFDGEKNKLHLLPTIAIEEVGKVLTFGAKKYKEHGWRGVDKRSRYFAPILRHAFAWWRGEDKDPESGLSHLSHLACSALFLLEAELTGLGEDDRPIKPPEKS